MYTAYYTVTRMLLIETYRIEVTFPLKACGWKYTCLYDCILITSLKMLYNSNALKLEIRKTTAGLSEDTGTQVL